ncbi:MAG: 30S ribosomal protein S16 [Anaerolineae bacterium]
MVRIRLRRQGAKKQPFYRIVVADREAPRDGRFIEMIGFYNPRAESDEEMFRIDVERAAYWLSVGAQPSEPVDRLLRKTEAYALAEQLKQQMREQQKAKAADAA